MDDERIDFGALDPSKNSRKWEALVARTVERSIIAPPPSAWSSLIRVRMAVAGLAALALLSWVPAMTREVPVTEERADPAYALMAYSQSGDTSALMESGYVW